MNYALIENETIEQNLKMILKKDQYSLIPEVLKQVGIETPITQKIYKLSGGQQQRTSIGRAIIKNPDILLCDEPTGALDYATGKEILKLIETVNQKFGNTVIMVTHNSAIADMADMVIRLHDGKIRDIHTNQTKKSAEELEW